MKKQRWEESEKRREEERRSEKRKGQKKEDARGRKGRLEARGGTSGCRVAISIWSSK